jgi:hypothetical protein
MPVRPTPLLDLIQVRDPNDLPSFDDRNIFLNPPQTPEHLFLPILLTTHRELEIFLSETEVEQDSSMPIVHAHLPPTPTDGGGFFGLRDVRAYISDIRIPFFFDAINTAAFCAHYFASRFRAMAFAAPTISSTLNLTLTNAFQVPAQRITPIISSYVDMTLAAYHHLYAQQLQPAFSQTFIMSRTYHPASRIRYPTSSFRQHHTHVVQQYRYLRNCDLVADTSNMLHNNVRRFVHHITNLSLYSPIRFDYRNVWAYLDFTCFHLVNRHIQPYLHHFLNSGSLALPWHQVDNRHRSYVTNHAAPATRMASDFSCFCRFLSATTTCHCYPVDLSTSPPHCFRSRNILITDVHFEVSNYLQRCQRAVDELINTRSRATYHPDAADHPDYFPDDDSTDFGDDDDTDTDASENSSEPPSSQ